MRFFLATLAAACWAGTGSAQPFPEAFSSFGAITHDGYAYVYGGHFAQTHTYSTETTLGKLRRLNLKSPNAQWEELPGGVACQGLTVVAHGGKIYRLGGMRPRNAPGEKTDQLSLATCQEYDIKLGTWASLPDLPEPRSSFDAVVVGSTIIATGGWTMHGAGKESTWCKTALVLDLAKSPRKWEAIPQPFVRRALTTVALGSKVYTVGGLSESGDVELTVNVFDAETRKWSDGPSLPGPELNGFSAATCVEGGRIYASPADGNIYRLSADGAKWEKVGSVAVPRFVHRMLGTGDGRLLVLAGASTSGNVSLTEVVTPVPVESPTLTTWNVPFTGAVAAGAAVVPNGDGFLMIGTNAEAFRVRVGAPNIPSLGMKALPPMPAAAEHLAACVLGEDRKQFAAVLSAGKSEYFAFDLTSRKWTTKPLKHAAPPAGFVAVPVDGKIWAVGGASRSGKGGTSRSIVELDPETGEWKPTAHTLPHGRANPAAAVHDGVLYVTGGPAPGLNALDIKSGKWTEHPSSPTPRAGGDLVPFGGKLYLAGGSMPDSGKPAGSLEAFDPVSKSWARVVEVLPGTGMVRLTPLPHRLLASSLENQKLFLTAIQLPESKRTP